MLQGFHSKLDFRQEVQTLVQPASKAETTLGMLTDASAESD